MIEFLISTFYFIIFCFIISKISFFKEKSISKQWFIIAYGIKVFTAVLLTLVYTIYYTDRSTADIFRYYDDGLIMFNAIKSNPKDYIQMLLGLDFNHVYFQNNYYQHMNFWDRSYKESSISDTHIIIRFNAFVRLFSFGYFQVHNVFINFVSLIGLTLFYKAFKPFLAKKEKVLFYIIFLPPSILFWGSGLLKESIIFFGLGMLLYTFFKTMKKFKLINLLLIGMSVLLLIYTKMYLLVALSIPILGFLINHFLSFKKAAYGYLFSISLFLLTVNIVPIVIPQLNLVSQITNKQQAFSKLLINVSANSSFFLPQLTDGLSILKTIPNAISNTLIRPFLWECNSLFVWFSAIENLLILGFIILTFIFRKKTNETTNNILYFSLIFVFCLFSIIGLTTPIFGAIVRYKIPGLLLLLISLLLIIDLEKIKTKHPFLNKIL